MIHDLEENGQKVLLIKPSCDTKGKGKIINRLKETRNVDILLSPKDKFLSEKNINKLFFCNHIIVDEVQFLAPSQVEELWIFNKKTNVPVTCFGLKSNFRGELFKGTIKLLALADEIRELETNSLCICGAPAKFNAKKLNGVYVKKGEEVEIEGANSNVEYVPLCGNCYFKEVFIKNEDEN